MAITKGYMWVGGIREEREREKHKMRKEKKK
jgi:hypothetical protein